MKIDQIMKPIKNFRWLRKLQLWYYKNTPMDFRVGVSTAELSIELGKSKDEAIDIENDVNKIINEN